MTDDDATEPSRVWVLADERAGTRSQALAVAESLGVPFRVREIAYGPIATLPNFVLGASLAGLSAESRAALAPPWPDLVIGAGRRTAPAARTIKRASGGRAFLCHVMYPGAVGARDFDLIAAPAHDGVPPAANLITTLGAPHRITGPVLAEATATWAPRLADLPRPWIALLVGGSTKRRRFTGRLAETLGRRASALARARGGSLLVSTSRRTWRAAEALAAAIDVPARVYRWSDGGENPYAGFLALADAVVVTGDSVSMSCEACATTAPVYIFAPPGFTEDKHARLHGDLYDKGYARPLGEDATDEDLHPWTHPPLNAAADVAAAIRSRMVIAE